MLRGVLAGAKMQLDVMKRREFITLLGGAAAVWPLAARAQEPGRTYRVGGLTIGPRTTPYFDAMFDTLRRVGFIEGQNLTIDWLQYGPRIDLVSEFAARSEERRVGKECRSRWLP